MDLHSRVTALDTEIGEAGAGVNFDVRIDGQITTSGAGTIKLQFAQNVQSGTSSILRGHLVVTEMP
jgi:hypothetical protein